MLVSTSKTARCHNPYDYKEGRAWLVRVYKITFNFNSTANRFKFQYQTKPEEKYCHEKNIIVREMQFGMTAGIN